MSVLVCVVLICGFLFYARSQVGTLGYTIVRVCFTPLLIGVGYIVLARAILKAAASFGPGVLDTAIFFVYAITAVLVIAVVVWWLNIVCPEWFDKEPLNDFDPTKYNKKNTTEDK